ncbi:NAD-dependent epimerase/dehydratase family protein [Kitasatospora sp. NBC_01250]|uniref:NAD-dependent epimerase/dehydratase family protein n=1 Tax=Kitasatospora sp. NBC_01250 TaxID=2903571 RepID=UPI002E311C46|nr:NAD-dependent epimerase/dehydratase family protein [Kitasatospora sp. NBC_01250]
MDIVGNGFLAGHLAAMAERHSKVVVAAAGVSAAQHTAPEAFRREAALVRGLVDRCLCSGERLVFFSTASSGIYNQPGSPGTEDGLVSPGTAYGRHKYSLEQELAASTVDCLILRLGHVVGPDQPAHQLLPALAAQVRSGRVRILSGARRDLIDVGDVVRIIDALLAAGVSRTTVNVASGHAVPVERIVERIQSRLGVTAEWSYSAPGVTQEICIAKLRRLVSAVDSMGFGPDYYRGVLDKYLPLGRLDEPTGSPT